MAKTGQKSINIPMASSAEGLKEDLQVIATRRAVSVSKVVAHIYSFAVSNQGSFPTELKNPRPKPGKHISSHVSEEVADDLTEWAKQLDRSRAYHCCFLLECVTADDDLRNQIFG